MDCPQPAVLLNHTPHTVRIHHADWHGVDAVTVLEPVLPLPRVQLDFAELDPLSSPAGPISRMATGVTGPCMGLPTRREGVWLIVSRMVAEANPDREDLLFPDRLIRDATGQVTGCAALGSITPPHLPGPAGPGRPPASAWQLSAPVAPSPAGKAPRLGRLPAPPQRKPPDPPGWALCIPDRISPAAPHHRAPTRTIGSSALPPIPLSSATGLNVKPKENQSMETPLQRVANQQNLMAAWLHISRDREPGNQHTAGPGPAATFGKNIASTIAALSAALLTGTWRPDTVRAASIPKPGGGARQLGISSLKDQIVERSALCVLDTLVDPWLLPFSFAYRRGLGVNDAVRSLTLMRNEGCTHVLRLDIADCFDNIPRRPVLEKLGTIIHDARLEQIVRLLVYRPAAAQGKSRRLGLHQGSCLSPLLCNVYLDDFDSAMMTAGFRVIRYADDIAIPLENPGLLREADDAARTTLTKLGLAVSEAKRSLRSFDDGVTFLGQTVTAGSTAAAEASSHPIRSTVYVTEQGSVLRTKGERMRVEVDGEQRFSIGWNRTRRVIAVGRVALTTPFLHHALTSGVDVVVMTANGRSTGRLHNPFRTNATARHLQHLAVEDAELSLDIARAIVAGKISNMRTGLLRLAGRKAFTTAAPLVQAMAHRRNSIAQAENIQSLMGIEGAASHAYFSGLRESLDAAWGFQHRQRRPPPDPINSMLSFGYTLLAHDTAGAVEAAGLDPEFGFLHGAQGNRPALALDLMEEFRPLIVDPVVLRCVNTGIVRPNDFEFTESADGKTTCLLSPEARKRFLAAYERRMLTLFSYPRAGRRVSYRQSLTGQAEQLAELVSVRLSTYQPVVWK